MSFQVMCAKGCGASVTVTDEMLEEAKNLNAPLNVAHDICPRDMKVFPEYRITVSVYRHQPLTEEEQETIKRRGGQPPTHRITGEKISSFGDKVQAPTFAEAFDGIVKSLGEQIEKISQMKHIIDQEGD